MLEYYCEPRHCNFHSTFEPICRPGHYLHFVNPTKLYPPPAGYMFRPFFTDEITDSIVENTNVHATQNAVKMGSIKWSPLRNKDLMAFMAILLFMEIVRLPFIDTCISRDRFKNILAALNISEVKERHNNFGHTNLTHKLELFLSGIGKIFYQPSQTLSIDERMVKSKSHICPYRYVDLTQQVENKAIDYS